MAEISEMPKTFREAWERGAQWTEARRAEGKGDRWIRWHVQGACEEDSKSGAQQMMFRVGALHDVRDGRGDCEQGQGSDVLRADG